MAKPKHKASTLNSEFPNLHNRSRRRPHVRKSSCSTVIPSSGLLVLLASVASASTVSGSPTPPSFLCPYVVDLASHSLRKSDDPSPSSFSSDGSIRPMPVSVSAIPRSLPDRYDKNDDGVWRRVDVYTLYGSTVSCAGSCRRPTSATTSLNEQFQVGSSSAAVVPSFTPTPTLTPYTSASASLASPTPTPTDDIRNSLPPGWKPSTNQYAHRTPLILSLSLVLALVICSFIVGCRFWRKKVKRNIKDVESSSRRKKKEFSEEEIHARITETQAKAKQKLWARATARWKANVRSSARRRKGKRFKFSQVNQSLQSADSSRHHHAESMSSRHSSSSIDSVPDQQREVDNPVPPSPLLSPPSLIISSVSPPAYQHHSQLASSSFTFGRSIRNTRSLSSLSTNDIRNSEYISYSSIPAAHAATDDKSLLARLADLASAPPSDDRFVGTSEAPQGSAPTWQDDDLEIVTAASLSQNANSFFRTPTTAPAIFPPPPSKDLLAAAERYDYSFSYDEMLSLEPELEPSAPPFDESSASPLEMLIPSAPPLAEDDELDSPCHPNEPRPGWDSSCPSEEGAPGQNHDRISVYELTMAESESRTHSTFPSPPLRLSGTGQSSSGLLPVSNDIVLPGYHPYHP